MARPRSRPRPGAQQRVAGHVEVTSLTEQVAGQIRLGERLVRPRIRDHRPLAVRPDEHHARARWGARGRPRAATSTPAARSSSRRRSPALVVPHASHQHRLGARGGQPRGRVRGGPAAVEADRRRGVAAGRERPGQAHHDVDHHVAEDDDPAHAASSAAISAARRAFRSDQPHVRLEARALGLAREVLEQERRHVLAAHPGALRRGQALGEHPVVEVGIELLIRGKRVRHHHRARPRCRPPRARARAPATSPHRVHAPRHRVARVREVEPREAVRAVAEHRHVRASRAARASRPRRGSTSRPRTPPRCRCAPAPRGRPTRPRCRARRGGRRRGRRWRTRGCRPARRDAPWPRRSCRRSRRAPPAGARSRTPHFTASSRSAIVRQRVVVEPHARLARHHAIVAGTAPPSLTAASTCTRHLQVARPRQPVGDDRALERHHRAPAGERLGHLRRDRRSRVLLDPAPRSPRRARRRGSPGCSRCPRVWSTSLIAVSRTWISIPSRRCSTSTTLPPRSATTRSRPARAPGRSGTTVESTIRRPAAVSPRRIASESSDTSTFPPDSTAQIDPSVRRAPPARASARRPPPRPHPPPPASSARAAAPSPARPRRPRPSRPRPRSAAPAAA